MGTHTTNNDGVHIGVHTTFITANQTGMKFIPPFHDGYRYENRHENRSELHVITWIISLRVILLICSKEFGNLQEGINTQYQWKLQFDCVDNYV